MVGDASPDMTMAHKAAAKLKKTNLDVKVNIETLALTEGVLFSPPFKTQYILCILSSHLNIN